MATLVLERLPAPVVQQAVTQGQIPLPSLVALGADYMEQNKPRKVVALLEPVFQGKIRKGGEAHDQAMNILCDAYDELDYSKKKTGLLQRILETTERSTLRSGAWQRLASMRMDHGDSSGAWQAFRQAQQDDPNSPAVGILEVQLLMVENRLEEAQQRARFWVGRMRRRGFDEDSPIVDLMQAVARDPAEAFASLGLAMAEGAGERLRAWLEAVAERPVGGYRLTDTLAAPAATAEDLRPSLRNKLMGMGVPKEQLAGFVDGMVEQVEGMTEGAVPTEAADGPDSMLLTPSLELAALERQWHEVFPLSKPFSVQDEPFEPGDAWDLDEEERWMSWLEAHPAAFDSLDILDDLATALLQHPEDGAHWHSQFLLGPVLRRAQRTVEYAYEGADGAHLTWLHAENRPGLRSLNRLHTLALQEGRADEADRLEELMLALNPNDNHGVRALVMNRHLRAGEDEQALALAGRYPDDVHPELCYGRVLALYRLGRMDDAQAGLCRALEALPKVFRYLTAARVRKPKLEPMGVIFGGDDQAWIYREEMGDAWRASPGLLDWLKKARKRCESAIGTTQP